MTLMQMRPPCHTDPASWDLDPGQSPHPPTSQLVQACLSQCPALALCRSLDEGDCYGVVAGRYRPWPSDSRLATVALGQSLQRVVGSIRLDVEAMTPGEALPAVSELARLYAVSRTTVRAALRWLAAEDVLTRPVDHRHRYRVANRTENPR